MSVDLDHCSPECADYALLLEAVTKERNALRTELAGISKERDEASVRAALAEELLVFMRDTWRPFGGRGCSLCVYENGVFKRKCKLHEWADANWTAGEDDAAEAIAWHMQVRADLISEEVKAGLRLFGEEPASAKEMRVLLEWIEVLRTGAWRKEEGC